MYYSFANTFSALSLFLGMAMITLKLWELASLALPLIILLAAQVLLMIVFTYLSNSTSWGAIMMPPSWLPEPADK